MIAELRPHLAELVPVVRRAVVLDPGALARIRTTAGTVSVFAMLPFRVLVSRTVAVDSDGASDVATLDATVGGAELLGWFDGDGNGDEPPARDTEWRGTLPPVVGWQRLDRIPEAVVRDLVQSGALALKEAAEREGVPGAQPRAEVADALLDAVVLTVSNDDGRTASISLRTISALVRMGFVPRRSQVTVDLAGRWTRVSGEYGAAYAESGGLGIGRF